MNEHHRELMSELTKVGLKPRLSTTNGSHAKIEWETGGKVHSILTSSTPSDRRVTLNARARLRRQLRDQGFYRTVPLPQSSFNGSVVGPSLEDRVAQLELDVVTLLDMISAGPGVIPSDVKDPTSSFADGWKAAADAVKKALEMEVMPNTRFKSIDTGPVQKMPSRAKSDLLFFIPCDKWSRAIDIAKSSGKSSKQVGVRLWRLKNQGLIEHDKARHLYRKKIEALL